MSSSATTAALYAATVSLSADTSAPHDAGSKVHHTQKGFKNPWESWNSPSGPAIGYAMVTRRLFGQANIPNTSSPKVTIRKPDFLQTRETTELRATWLGHAAYFVEFPSGLRVLFDPVFSERCSPFTWLGPKRYTDVPCQIEDIPFVDAVVISHNHYDHMDHPTIMKIIKQHPNVHFFVPLKNKKWFMASRISPDQVTELDWWEERDMQLLPAQNKTDVLSGGSKSPETLTDAIIAKFGCLPCQHTSARTPFDQGHTLWASWSVESGGKKVWFGGDTGYRGVPKLPKDVDDYGPGHDYPHCPAFKEIGDHRGPFDLALIPIGAYDPRFVMSSMHANPFDSVNIFKDVKAKKAMGIHWGTWVLTEEDVHEPPILLKKALKRNGISEEGVFDVCDIGESREFA